MKFHEVMCEFNYNMSAIGRALGVTEQCVANWKKKDFIPVHRQCQLEVITKGKLKASISEHQF
jgi:hypothetical protein